jgi:hypothetical protein
MRDDLSLSVVRHPLRRDLVDRLSAQFVPGISLRDLRDQYASPTIPVLIHLNGILVPEEKWSTTYPLPGDFILFSAALHGDDGKMVFRIVLMIAIAAFAAWAGPALAAGMGLSGGMLTAMGAVFAGAITVVGGMLVNALLPPPAATAPPAPDTALDSPSYSWAPGNTSQQGVPVARWYGKHRIYGNIIGSYLENVGKDQYINSLISLGLGPIDSLGNFKINDEPYQAFNDVTIEARYGHLNQTAVSNFKKLKIEYPGSVEVSWGNQHIHTTQGDDFDMLEIDMTLPQGLWSTGEGGIAQHEVSFTIEVRKVGTPDWIPVILTGPPTFSSYVEARFGDGHTAPRWSKGKMVDLTVDLLPLPSIIPRATDPFVVTKWWDYQAGSSTYTDHVEGESAGGEWSWHWCGPVPEEYRDNDDAADHIESVVQAPPEQQNHVITVQAASHSPLRYTYTYKLPSDADKGQYEIRITRQNQNMNDAKYGDRLYYAGCREVWRERYVYPRQVLVSVRAKATDQLSGSFRFSCVGKMALVRVWDGVTGSGGVNIKTSGLSTTVTTVSGNFPALMAVGAEIIANGQQRWVVSIQGPTQVTVDRPVNWSNGGAGYSFTWRAFTIAYSNNPAWVAYDIFTQPVLAGDGSPGDPFRVVRFDGFNPSRIDLPKFKEWADYCDELVPDGEGGTEKRIQFNGGYDFDTSMWEAAFKVAAIGRAVPIWNGVHLTLAIDKPADPVTLFTVGNIEESRFKENFLPMEERATLIEVDYANMENNYDRDKLTVFRPDALTTAYRASMDLFGVTKESQVWRAAMYRLNCNKYLIRTVEIDVDIEAINCQLGDVVYIQHDVPRWGAAGDRIVSATANTVVIDQAVTLEGGLSYKLLIRLAEDVVHEREVVSVDPEPGDPENITRLVVNPPFDLSADFSVQTVYNVGATVRYAGKIFECIQQTSVPSPLPTDISYWVVTQLCPLPQKYDIYAFGQVSNTAKLFRITDISLTQDQKATLTMIEYRPEVYESELAVPSLNDRTQKKLKKLEPTNVVLAPITTTGPRGDVIWGIGITFTESTSPQYVRSHVWYALKTGVKKPDLEWLYAGATTGESFEILGVEENKKYYVVLLPENITGDKLRISNATIHKIVISPHWTGDVRHPFIDGFANVHTSGSSTAATTTNDAFIAVSIGTTLIANKLARLVIAKADNNTVTVNEAVNWDNNGTGYSFEYNPLMSDYLKYLSTVSAQNRLELDQMADDGYIIPAEKARAEQLWESIIYRGNPTTGVLTLEANNVGVDTTAFAAAYAALDDYLNEDLALFDDMLTATFLPTGDELTPPLAGLGRRKAWNKRWNDYYNAKDDLKKAITDALQELASEAFAKAANSERAADGRVKSYFQATAPTLAQFPNMGYGDFWFDTDDSNAIYVNTAAEGQNPVWVLRPDSPLGNAILDVATAQATADGKVVTFFSTSTPTAKAVGDLWYNSNDKLLKRWSGSSWVLVSNAFDNTNQLTDGAGLGTKAVWSNITGTGKPADGATKNILWSQASTSPPSNPTTGDQWYQTDTKLLKRWTGSAWETWANAYDNTNQLVDGAKLGENAIWSSVTGTGKPANGADVTKDQLAGSGVNVCHPRYSTFEEPTLPPLGKASTCTPVLDTTKGYFGSQCLRLDATGSNAYCHLGKNSTDWNVKITPNKKWLFSAYVMGSVANTNIQFLVGYPSGDPPTTTWLSSGHTLASAGVWYRVTKLFDMTSLDVTKVVMRVDNDEGAGTSVWFDGIMFEEAIGNQTTPSAYSPPAGFVGGSTAQLVDSANLGKTAEWNQVSGKIVDLSDATLVTGNLAANRIASSTLNAQLVLAGSIHTATSGARFVIDSSSIRGYDSNNVIQCEITSADGKFKAGNGSVVLDRAGLSFIGESGVAQPTPLFGTIIDSYWVNTLMTWKDTVNSRIVTQLDSRSTYHAGYGVLTNIYTLANATYDAMINLYAQSGSNTASLLVDGKNKAVWVAPILGINMGATTPTRNLDVTGNWGGNVVKSTRTTTGTNTINTKALVYRLVSSGSGVTGTFNLSGVFPKISSLFVDGTFFVVCVQVTGGATSVVLEIDNVQERVSTSNENLLCVYADGGWRFIGV